MPSDLCFYVGCKKEWLPKQQAILRVLGPDEYRPGWFYMMCPNCGIRGPVYEKQADAMTGWAAMWATKAPVPESQGVRERILEHFVHTGAGNKGTHQMLIDGEWYAPKWGCDTLQHILDALQSPEPPQGEAGA